MVLERGAKRWLIDRQAALNALEFKWAGKAAIDAVKELPAADAVEVVRCKDCQYSYVFNPWCGEDALRYCNRLRRRWAKDSDMNVNDDDYCSSGIRSTDG